MLTLMGFPQEILSVHPRSPAVTAPVGHAAALRCAGTCAAPVPMQETSLTLRYGPVGPFQHYRRRIFCKTTDF